MDDKNEQIYSQYLLQIDNVYKNKGIVYIETEDGLYMIKSYNYTDKKINMENKIKNILASNGYGLTDLCIKNKANEYISYNKYMNKYIMKKWFYGEECDINKIEDICRASANIAKIHNLMKEIEVVEEEASKVPDRNLIKEYKNYIGEIKRVKKYIYNKKKKNRLELDIIKSIDYYYKESEKYLKRLEESSYEKLYNEAIECKKICHGAYTHHSVLLINDTQNNTYNISNNGFKEKFDVATINFDKVHYGVQIYDLYTLLRKAMEKNNWNVEMAKEIINAYNENYVLTYEEKEILLILLGYPEKYRKLINGYYNGNKSWLSIRIYEKLNELVSTEEIRQEFLTQLEVWLLNKENIEVNAASCN